jgi:hypothetical protein
MTATLLGWSSLGQWRAGTLRAPSRRRTISVMFARPDHAATCGLRPSAQSGRARALSLSCPSLRMRKLAPRHARRHVPVSRRPLPGHSPRDCRARADRPRPRASGRRRRGRHQHGPAPRAARPERTLDTVHAALAGVPNVELIEPLSRARVVSTGLRQHPGGRAERGRPVLILEGGAGAARRARGRHAPLVEPPGRRASCAAWPSCSPIAPSTIGGRSPPILTGTVTPASASLHASAASWHEA